MTNNEILIIRQLQAAAKGRASGAKPNGSPSNLVLTVMSDTSIKLDWTIGSTNQDGCHIYDSTNALVATVTGDTATKTLTGLSQSTKYGYYVKEYKGNNESAASATIYAVTFATALLDSNTVAWYDYLKSVTKDSNNYVSQWDDLSTCGHHLLQNTDGLKPLLTSNGVLFDGSDDYMSVTFTNAQPCYIYAVVRQVTWKSEGYFWDGGPSNNSIDVKQLDTTPGIKGYAGSAFTNQCNDLAINTFGIIRWHLNGANSKLQVNKNTAITGNFGSLAGLGVKLGSQGINGHYGNVEFKEFIMRKVADSEGSEAAIFNYLSQKHGFFF